MKSMANAKLPIITLASCMYIRVMAGRNKQAK